MAQVLGVTIQVLVHFEQSTPHTGMKNSTITPAFTLGKEKLREYEPPQGGSTKVPESQYAAAKKLRKKREKHRRVKRNLPSHLTGKD